METCSSAGGRSPTGRYRFGRAAEPTLSVSGVDYRDGVILLARRVKDLAAFGVDVSL